MNKTNIHISFISFKIFFTFFIALFFNQITISQVVNDRDNNFFLIKGGIGVPYSYYGINMELGKKKLGFYASAGYMNPQNYPGKRINESFNFGCGAHYYFNKFKLNIRPKVGLHLGWLNNYYRESLATIDYNPIVYGAAVTGGFEYYWNYMFIEFDCLVDPSFAIINKSKHPYYNDGNIHISPSIGIGINFSDFVKSMSRKGPVKQNQGIVSFFKRRETINNNKKYYKIINSDCICSDVSLLNKSLIKGSCGNIVVYQQMFGDIYFFVNINLDSIKLTNNCNNYEIDDRKIKINLQKVENISDSVCCEIYNNKKSFDGNFRYKAVKGNISIIINKKQINVKNEDNYRITIKLSNLKMINTLSQKGEEIYFDEIVIWDIQNKEFCRKQ